MDKGNCTREVCQMCHEVSRVGFWVPDEMWFKAVRKGFEHAIVCLSCFTRIADEKQLTWDKEIEFYPVSWVTHSSTPTMNNTDTARVEFLSYALCREGSFALPEVKEVLVSPDSTLLRRMIDIAMGGGDDPGGLYNPTLENTLCSCGHVYYRHFDTYDDMTPTGCKYCECGNFEFAALHTENM